MGEKISENPLIKRWLRTKRTQTTRNGYKKRVSYVLAHFKMTPEELLEMEPKEVRELLLIYQNEAKNLKGKPLSNNSILARQTAVASFMDYFEKTIEWKRNTKVRPRPDVTSHVFSNGDLSRMFQVGDIRDKAILALATSLGWETSSFTEFKRETLSNLLERQKETGEAYVYFKQIREKTGAPRLGVLNPSAIDWCNKWLKQSEGQKKPNNRMRTSDIFNLSEIAIYQRMKILAKRAGIKTTGSIKFHAIRKWCMSGLSRSGMNEWQVKYVLGKNIPMADATYLQTLQEEVMERYPSAYENYLNLETTIPRKAVEAVSKELEMKSVEIAELQRKLERIESSKPQLEGLLNRVLELERRLSSGNKE